jgi:hypothetical protein
MNQMTPIQPTGMTLDYMISKYIALRDRKEAIEEKHKVELVPYREAMSLLEAYMLEALDAQGLQSMKSPHGTAFKKTRTSAKVTSWADALQFIKDNNAWELLEQRVSKIAAQQIIDETQQPIPGVETTSEVVCNVQRARTKGA